MKKLLVVLALLCFAMGGVAAIFAQSSEDEHLSQSVDQIVGQILKDLKQQQDDSLRPHLVRV